MGFVKEELTTPPTLAELRARREEILRIAAAHGASNVRVFGSVARGDARPDSDVDLLAEFEPNRDVFDQAELIGELCEMLGREVYVAPAGQLGRIAERVEREAVSL